MSCTFPRCECMCHPKDCVFKLENQRPKPKLKGFMMNDVTKNVTEVVPAQEGQTPVKKPAQEQPTQTTPIKALPLP